MGIQTERHKLSVTVGARENAVQLFKEKVSPEDVERCGILILQHLDLVDGTNSITSSINALPEKTVPEWAGRIYANTLAHLCETDPEVRATYLKHRSYVPDDGEAASMFMGRVYQNFLFFLWVIASPTKPADPQNVCVVRFVVLNDVILLENIDATRNGQPGGWSWLDKAIVGLRDIAKGFDIKRIKAIATNERVYRAFLRRGFRDRVEIEGFERHVENYAKPIELVLE